MPIVGDHGAPVVKILLSVRDGAEHLDELLVSVRAQTLTSWRLLVADDGSVDSGMSIVERHASTDARIAVVARRQPEEALGPAASFMELLSDVAEDELFAFCDQDDVWFPHKLRWSVDALRDLGFTGLRAVATDAIVTDDVLALRAPSALAQHRMRGQITLGKLLVNNIAIGATVVGTGELARIACELGRDVDARMHDWWCVVLAAYGGRFGVVTAPTMYWRRHSGTVTGSRPPTWTARAIRRTSTIRWAHSAASVMLEHLSAADHRARRSAQALAAVDGTPSVVDVFRLAWHGVHAWSLRHELNLLAAAAMLGCEHVDRNHEVMMTRTRLG